MIEFEVATYLFSRPAVSALVNGISAVRIPQSEEPPYIVYKLLRGDRYYHSTGSSKLVEAYIELLFVGETYPKARAIYEAVRTEIDGFAGTWGNTTIDASLLTPPSTYSGNPTQGDDVGFPAVKAVVQVFHQE